MNRTPRFFGSKKVLQLWNFLFEKSFWKNAITGKVTDEDIHEWKKQFEDEYNSRNKSQRGAADGSLQD